MLGIGIKVILGDLQLVPVCILLLTNMVYAYLSSIPVFHELPVFVHPIPERVAEFLPHRLKVRHGVRLPQISLE